MDKRLPYHQDDLSDIERRLSAWRPNTEGLDVDAVLFAAGIAAGRQGRSRLWPAVFALLIVPMVGLGAWAVSERSGRLALSMELAKHGPSANAAQQSENPSGEYSRYTPSPNDYLHQRRRAEQDASYYVASVTLTRPDVVDPESRPTTILRAGQWSDLLE
jgi:hypothetical protein